MKQPALGLRLTALRKARGLTQEELVERCNISVRTIQRIEGGEVTPRSYTVKTILAAMDYAFESVAGDVAIADDEPAAPVSGAPDPLAGSHPSLAGNINVFTLALFGGGVYLLTGMFEGASDYFRAIDNTLVFGTAGYIVVKVIALLSYVLFMRGFMQIGTLFENYLLRIASMVAVAATVLVAGYDIVSLAYDADERLFIMTASSVTFGAVGILFGIALKRLDRHVGTAATAAAVLEIIAGCCLATVVFVLFGIILLLPAIVVEMVIIYTVIAMIREGAVPQVRN